MPTMQEQGFDGFEATTWYGLAGPGKLPTGIADKINRDVNTVLAMPDVQERLDTYGAEDGGGSREKFAQFISSEIDKWAQGRQGRQGEGRRMTDLAAGTGIGLARGPRAGCCGMAGQRRPTRRRPMRVQDRVAAAMGWFGSAACPGTGSPAALRAKPC